MMGKNFNASLWDYGYFSVIKLVILQFGIYRNGYLTTTEYPNWLHQSNTIFLSTLDGDTRMVVLFQWRVTFSAYVHVYYGKTNTFLKEVSMYVIKI